MSIEVKCSYILVKVKKSSPTVRGGSLGGVIEQRLFDGEIYDFESLLSIMSHQKVEAAGVEPASKPGTQKLSTRLFCD